MASSIAEQVASLRDLTTMFARTPSLLEAAGSLRAGHGATIDGAWGSSKAMALAALARHAPATLVVLLPRAADVEALDLDLRAFGTTPPAVLAQWDDPDLERPRSGLPVHESLGQRLAVLKALRGPDPPRILLASIAAVLEPVPPPDEVRRNSRALGRGETLPIEDLTQWLVSHGWVRRDAVELPGEFSLRGGIVDVFPFDAVDPLRVEWFGDEIESIREFSVETQRSLREIESAELTALGVGEAGAAPAAQAHLADVLPPKSWIALVEPSELKAEGKQFLARLEHPGGAFSVEAAWQRCLQHPTVVVASLPHASLETTCTMHVESVERFSGEVAKVKGEIDRAAPTDLVVIACHNEAEVKRLGEVLSGSETAAEGRLVLCVGTAARGFRWILSGPGDPRAGSVTGVVVVSDHELFHRSESARSEPRRRYQSRAIDSFVELRDGDYVVHLGHGIGVFRGMRMLDKNDQLEEHLTIEFADNTLVYVPASKIDLVQRYVGSSQAAPRLSKIGGAHWERRKRAAQLAVQDLASELIEIQAARQAQPGVACPTDSEWQRDFEASFPYVETPDQLTAMEEIRRDLESTRPMDRLLCGDVGYGKTELAMRAAFKCVDFGKQVAVLVPTTVLAQQHLRTFRERMAEFPFSVEVLSRFQTRTEQKKILRAAAEGGVDILIGTHRLLTGDVAFHDLGLVIIDEEQRFGVEHKERLKHLRSQVDVLTMTATPIPRTLHSALLGIRDISNLETAPQNRLAVETRIGRFDPAVIRHAVLRELNRGGQVYFVHNRVGDIRRIAEHLRRIVPEARVAIVHGQMPEHSIEEGMVAFLERRAEILLATTIIESGLDIPSANTIFINEGDHYGLADLHQLRGRVGRSNVRAYCYVLVDEQKVIKPEAQRRLKAIEEYSALGSGFQIALRDLEIRGAGNILGAEQSGHIAAIGYELYCQLLENAVRARKKLPVRTHLDVTIELPWKAYLPADYLPGERLRIDAYRRLARSESLDNLVEFRRELEDRAGALPAVAQNFLDLMELRILAQIWQIESIRPDEDGSLVFKYRHRRRAETLENLRKGEFKVVDPTTAYARVPPSQRDAAGYCALLKRLLQPS